MTDNTMTELNDLGRNLRLLCARQRSVSDVCRRIGINRQQFARYLKGESRPSAHNLRRICQHFGISEPTLDLPHPMFARRHIDAARAPRGEVLMDAFPGDVTMLRRMAGSYLAYFRSPSHPDHVVCAFVDISERGGLFHSRTLERIRHPETGQISRAKFVGLVSAYEGTLFMVERGRISRGGISETVMEPVHRGSRTWFSGMLLGFSWRERKPYASRCIWKRLRASMSARDALSACGTIPLSSRKIDPIVAEYVCETAES